MTRQAKSLAANTLGTIAQKTLLNRGSAEVMGVTSRGIFLKTEPKWVIFLSFESYRGPLTVNLAGDTKPLKALTPGGLVQLTPGLITAPELDLTISTQNSIVWQPEPASTPPSQQSDLLSRMKSFAREAYKQKAGEGLSDLLPALLPHITVDTPNSKGNTQDFKPDILSIQVDLKRRELSSALQHSESLLGRGGGLTPSGDDFIIGLLLTLSRWKAVLGLDEDLSAFNDQIVDAAYKKTTTLSANLIECAARGLADERLIAALDYLMSGAGEQDQIFNQLLDWGNSSGVDALVGMVVGISTSL